MEEKDEIVISLSDVWNIIKKNAAFIIVVTLICAIGSFFITRYFIPKSYTSSIQLYVDTSNDDENKNNLNILSEQTYAQKCNIWGCFYFHHHLTYQHITELKTCMTLE